MKLETKTAQWINLELAENLFQDKEIKKLKTKKWTSNESLVTRLETDFFNPRNQLVGKSPEYIIGYFLEKIMLIQKELQGKEFTVYFLEKIANKIKELEEKE